MPYAVREQMKREKYLTQVILHETNLKLVTKRLKPALDVTHKNSDGRMAKDEIGLDLEF